MTHVRTPSGFEADIDETQLDDYRLMRAIRAAQENKMAVVDVLSFVLGPDEDRLVEHLITTTGRASMADIEAEISEIFAQLGSKKK